MRPVTELHTRILESLHRYKFLTASQLQRLGISSSMQVLWRELRKLRSHPTPKRALVGMISFPPSMRVEHVERVYYLTRSGANVLAEILGIDPGELDFQKVTSVYHRDYWHRKYCIDFHIWLTQALEEAPWDLEIVRWDRYFDKTGANRTRDPNHPRLRAHTRVELASAGGHLIPDVNFILGSADTPERQAMFCLEMCNGKNTKRVLEQMERHTVAMRDGALAEKYRLEQNYRALFLFAEQSLLEAVRSRWEELGKDSFAPWFFLGHLEEVEKSPLRGWEMVGADERMNFVTGKGVEERER